jgi:hypothetical protein
MPDRKRSEPLGHAERGNIPDALAQFCWYNLTHRGSLGKTLALNNFSCRAEKALSQPHSKASNYDALRIE